MKLKDNAALVTGGSSGIGAEVCLQLAAEGANVGVVASEDLAKAQIVVDKIGKAGGRATALVGNIAESGSVVKLLADAEAEQTKVVGDAIKKHGQAAVNFEIMKRQVDGLTELASSGQTKTLILPSEITKVLGGIELLAESVRGSKSK